MECSSLDPILELTVLKNSWQDNLGETVYYYIDGEHEDLIDYTLQDGEIPNNCSNTLDSTDNEEQNDDVVSRLEKQLED